MGHPRGVITVTLNPALDHALECDRFTPGQVNRVLAQRLTAGGKGINVAAYLSGAVRPVTAVGLLGGENAAPFEDLFRARGIEDACLRLPGRTRVNLKVHSRPEGTVTELNLPGLEVTPADWQALLEALDRAVLGARFAVLAGSLPPGLPDTAYAELIHRLRAGGCRVALDSSGAALREGLAAAPEVVKPNRRELEELVGQPLPRVEDVLEAARGLVDRARAGLVVASLGAEGALAVRSDEALLAVPPAVQPLSTVGAGDALLSGFLVGLLQGDPLEACLRRGTAYAVGTLPLAGPALPKPAALQELMDRVEVLPLPPRGR